MNHWLTDCQQEVKCTLEKLTDVWWSTKCRSWRTEYGVKPRCSVFMYVEVHEWLTHFCHDKWFMMLKLSLSCSLMTVHQMFELIRFIHQNFKHIKQQHDCCILVCTVSSWSGESFLQSVTQTQSDNSKTHFLYCKALPEHTMKCLNNEWLNNVLFKEKKEIKISKSFAKLGESKTSIYLTATQQN